MSAVNEITLIPIDFEDFFEVEMVTMKKINEIIKAFPGKRYNHVTHRWQIGKEHHMQFLEDVSLLARVCLMTNSSKLDERKLKVEKTSKYVRDADFYFNFFLFR